MARRARGRPAHPDVLTRAEWAILDHWRHGMGRLAIARLRDISAYAVRYHLRNISQKLGVEHYSELRHWPGFAATSARKEKTAVNSTSLALGPLGQVSLLTTDAARAEAWYRDVLGLDHLFTFGPLCFFDCAGTRLFIRQLPAAEWRPSSILYFTVGDIGAAHAALAERDVHFAGAPHVIHRHDDGTEEWMAFFDDPDSNTLAIMARVGGSAS